MWQLLAQHTKTVSDLVKALLLAIRTNCPVQKECNQAIDSLKNTINQLDQAILTAMSQILQPNASSSLLGFQEKMLESIRDIRDNLHPLATAAKGEAEKLGHQVATFTENLQTQEYVIDTAQQVMEQTNSPSPQDDLSLR